MKTTLKITLWLLLAAPFSIFCQKYQIGLSAGPALLYVVEDAAEPLGYYYGIAYQNEFIFLNKDANPNFGFSLTSASTEQIFPNSYSSGIISNTSLTASKYFSTRWFNFLQTGLELGAGLNYENMPGHHMGNSLMMNLQLGGRLQAEICKGFFIHAKGLVVGQDVANIIRGFSTGYWKTAGEDLHLLLLFGISKSFGHREE